MATLFDSLALGDLVLPNRIIMCPLTRLRSTQPGDVPNALMAEYYTQRATAGLIISEATQISQQGKGYPGAPGIYTAEQVEGWKLVTNSVHSAGGHMFLQLWHVGRMSHPSFQPYGGLPVSASATKPAGQSFTAQGAHAPLVTPRALEPSELPDIVAAYRRGAENAKTAGFDGVEVHGANGYLLAQFMEDGVNKRTDRYGGSTENRARLLLEVVDATIAVWGAGRVGVRLSPYGTAGNMHDSDPVALYRYVLEQLSARRMAYAHVVEPRSSKAGSGAQEAPDASAPSTSALFRKYFHGTFISAGGYTAQNAPEAVESGRVDAVAFGRWYIANPDLVERLYRHAPLNPYDRATFYTQGAHGYTDYPTLEQASLKAAA